jgi:hypothetical protein
MDVDNGSKDGKPVIIVMPKYLKAAEDTYNDCRTFEQEHRTTTANHSNTNLLPSDKSAHDEYAEKMAAFLHVVNLNDSDSDNRDTKMAATPTSGKNLVAPKKAGNRRRPSAKSTEQYRSSGHSYVAVTKSSLGSSSTMQPRPNELPSPRQCASNPFFLPLLWLTPNLRSPP